MRVEIDYKIETKKPITKKVIDVYVLDCSGSMGYIHNDSKLLRAIEGIHQNMLVDTPEGITKETVLCTFDSHLSLRINISKIEKVSLNALKEQASKHGQSTPLYDAIGKTVNYVKQLSFDNVIFKIFTDGEENASREFSKFQIKELIEILEKEGWTFTFVGTDKDVENIIRNIKIDSSNTLKHDNTSRGMMKSMEVTLNATASYFVSLEKGEDVSKGFYKK